MIKSNLLPEITLDMHTSTSLIYAKDRLVVFRKQTALKMFPLSSTIFFLFCPTKTRFGTLIKTYYNVLNSI